MWLEEGMRWTPGYGERRVEACSSRARFFQNMGGATQRLDPGS